MELAIVQKQLFICTPEGTDCVAFQPLDLQYHWGRMENFCQGVQGDPTSDPKPKTYERPAYHEASGWWGSRSVRGGAH